MSTSLRDTNPEQPAPVRAVAQALHGWINKLGALWVIGEVTQLSRRHGMRTAFLQLRDPLADLSIQVTVPTELLDASSYPIQEGQQVIIYGRPTYYQERGTLSLAAREIRPVGEGALRAQIEQLRQKLASEGLFTADNKKALPTIPTKIGLVSAQNSAAEADVLATGKARWPGAQVVIKHAAMQGFRAVSEMVVALTKLDQDPAVSVIILARGGGSFEDLLPFSDETLLRTVAALTTPVVSAIGHESDTPLIELIADYRAATPTAAAKAVFPDISYERDLILDLRHRVNQNLRQRLEIEIAQINELSNRPVLQHPGNYLTEQSENISSQLHRLRLLTSWRVQQEQTQIANLLGLLRATSPESTLRRGYVIVTQNNQPVTLTELASNTAIELEFITGNASAIITEINLGENYEQETT